MFPVEQWACVMGEEPPSMRLGVYKQHRSIFLSWERDTFTPEGKQIFSREGAGVFKQVPLELIHSNFQDMFAIRSHWNKA